MTCSRGERKRSAPCILKNVAGFLQLLQVTLINFRALALKIGAEIAARVRTFIPIESEPVQSIVNGARGFLGVARAIGVLDPQHQCAAGVLREKPVEQRGARAADVKIASRRWSKADANGGRHGRTLATDEHG